MIYYQNSPVKIIAVDQGLINVVWRARPGAPSFWVKLGQLTADNGLTEILNQAQEAEDWQIKHHRRLEQKPLPIKRPRRKG